MTASAKITVYVSSTFRDLREHRATLRVALEKAGYDVESMERYPAFDERPLDRCLHDVENSDIYVLLIAHRYGHRVPGANVLEPPLSITEREYRHALAHNIPCLAFCVDSNYEWAREYVDDPDGTDDLSLRAFRQNVLAMHGVSFFTTPDNLAKEVLSSLSAQIATNKSFPRAAQIVRLRAMAQQLLDTGKAAWKMPSFVAPLALEAIEGSSDDRTTVTLTDVASRVAAGANLVLFGDGGVGKTIFLLELGAACLSGTNRVPLYIDAAVWGRSGQGLLDYLSNSLAAHQAELSTHELVRFAQEGYVTLLINGWNEIGSGRQAACADSLREMLAGAGAVTVVLVSRSTTGLPEVPEAKTVQVLGLTWRGQRAVLRAELPEEQAQRAIAALAMNTRLRIAARSPIILRGVVELQRRNAMGSSAYGLLQGVVDAFEAAVGRVQLLRQAPLFGFQAEYLEGLASSLMEADETNLERREILSVLGATSARLTKEHVLGQPVQPTDVLDALCQEHLLHLEGDLVRFAHQRFLEFFAARRIIRLVGSELEADRLALRMIVNSPSWDDAVELVLDEPQGDGKPSLASMRLISIALETDLGVCCDFVGRVRIRENAARLRASIISSVQSLTSSSDRDIAELGLAYAVSTRFPEFSDQLWSVIEHANQQVRLHGYRLDDSGISLKQLGSDAEQRLSTWTPDRRAEFVHEIADHPDNFNYVIRLAYEDPDRAVRLAAIRALFWNYPASDAGLSAWLAAPVDVQVDSQLLNSLDEEMLEPQIAPRIRAQLQALVSRTDLSDDARIGLALALPADLAEPNVDAIIRRLREHPELGDRGGLLPLAQRYRAGELLALARDLTLGSQGRASWPTEIPRSVSSQERAGLFEEAWQLLQGDKPVRIDWSAVGPLATESQVSRALLGYLTLLGQRTGNTAADVDRQMAHRSLLAHVPGDFLVASVIDACSRVAYSDTLECIRLLGNRLPDPSAGTAPVDPWRPSVSDIQRLEAALRDTFAQSVGERDDAYAVFSNLAVRTAPESFGWTVVEACRRELIAWARYHESFQRWQQHPTTQRPNNPIGSAYLNAACRYLGTEMVRELLTLFDHANALDVLPGALASALNGRWDTDHRTGGMRGIESDLAEGNRRRKIGRAFRQPSDELQEVTDAAAQRLSEKLDFVRGEIEKTGLLAQNPTRAHYRVRGLLGMLSHMPSRYVVPSVLLTLQAGLSDRYALPDALRALLRQGWPLDDIGAIRQLEKLAISLTGETWIPHNEYYLVSNVCELIHCVPSADYLSQPTAFYRERWRRFAGIDDMARSLGAISTDLSWETLLDPSLRAADGVLSETHIRALANGVTSSRFATFLEFFNTASLPARGRWVTDGLTSRVAAAIASDESRLTALLDSCRAARSPGKDQFALAVSLRSPDADRAVVDYAMWMLESDRVASSSSAEYHLILELMTPFRHGEDATLGGTMRNLLRQNLFDLAQSTKGSSAVCRKLLAAVERSRREFGRPTDEPRHPRLTDPAAWTRIFGA